MQIKDIMTREIEYVPSKMTLKQAAQKMAELDCGFLPIGDSEQGKLKGVVTDRDITIRAVAEGLDPDIVTVSQIKTDKVLYCFEDDDVETAAKSMEDQCVYRLIVLDNRDSKRLCGIVSLGDIVRHGHETLAGKTVKGITAQAA